jgi:dihydrofolate reductase
VARDNNGGIGKSNRIPWQLHTDMKRFKTLTMGHHLIMGRRTYESIGKPLIGRVMIVITKDLNYFCEECIVVHSINEAIEYAKANHETEVFIIGGGEVFSQCINIADKIYLTDVHADVEADVFFPNIEEDSWKIIRKEGLPKTEKDEYPSNHKILTRIH